MGVKQLAALFEPSPNDDEISAESTAQETASQRRSATRRVPRTNPTLEHDDRYDGLPEGSTTRAFDYIALAERNDSDEVDVTESAEAQVTTELLAQGGEDTTRYSSLQGRKRGKSEHSYPPSESTKQAKNVIRRTQDANHQPVPATELFSRKAAPLWLPKLDEFLQKVPSSLSSVSHGDTGLAENGMFEPMDRLERMKRTLEDLELNRVPPPAWRDRNEVLGTAVNLVLNIMGSSFVTSFYSLQGLINTFQIFALILSTIAPSNGSADPDTWRNLFLHKIPNALALYFATSFWKTVVMLFVLFIISGLLMFRFWQTTRECVSDTKIEGLYRPAANARPWELITISFVLTILYLPLSTIALHVVFWSDDLWVVPNPYFNATSLPPDLTPLGPPEQFREPLDFCWTTTMEKNNINWAPVLVIVSAISWAMLTIWFPLHLRKVIVQSAPKVDPYTELGHLRSQAGLDREYLRLLDRDQSPFQFLYNRFRRNWAQYESIYLFSKVTTLLIIATLDVNNCLFRTLNEFGRSALTVARQVMLLAATLSYFVLQTIYGPFTDPVSNASEWVSRFNYVATSLLAVISALDRDASSILLGPVLYVVYVITYGLSVYFTIINFGFVHRIVKRFMRRIDAGIDLFNPRLDLSASSPHLRRRIWQEILTTLILTTTETAVPESQKMQYSIAPDANSYPPYLLDFLGTPGERHVENLKILREVGLDAYVKAEALIYGADKEWFHELQQEIQSHFIGPDSYYRDPETIKQGPAAQFFGNAWWIPFPPSIVMRYDDGSRIVLRNVSEMQEYVRQNQDEVIASKRRIRQALRALDGQVIQWTYHDMEHVGSSSLWWPFRKQAIRAHKAKVYHLATLDIGKKGELYSNGLNLGSGMDVQLEYEKKLKLNGTIIGLNDDYELTAPLAKFFAQNKDLIMRELDRVQSSIESYREFCLKEGRWKSQTMSYRFLMTIYNRPQEPAALVKTALETEQDQRLHGLLQNNMPILATTYQRLMSVGASDLSCFWYLYWDDLWRLNQDVIGQLRLHAADFDPHYPTSIAYTPLPRAALESFLVQRGLFGIPSLWTKYWFHPGRLNKLYLRLHEITFQGTSQAIMYHLGKGSTELDMEAVDQETRIQPSSLIGGGGTSYADGSIRARPNFRWEGILSDQVRKDNKWQNHIYMKLGAWMGLTPFWTADASRGLSVDVRLDERTGKYVIDSS